MLKVRLALLAAAAVLAMAAPSSAAFIVSPGATGTGINAIDAPCTNPTNAPNATIFGCLNINHDQDVKYDVTGDVIDFGAGGQAKIIPSGSGNTGFNNLMISLPGLTFSTFVINIETDADGSVTFMDNFGDSSVQSLSKNGNNFFTITGMDFSWISFTSTVDAADVKQVRFDGLLEEGSNNPPPGVPEPATLALFGAALAGFGAFKRRTKKAA